MPKITFDLTGEYVELNQLLKLAGLCNSGGEGKMLVSQGNVTVDGVQELRRTAKIRAGQVVRLDDTTITVRAAEMP
jgi:ribosome-associated protein